MEVQRMRRTRQTAAGLVVGFLAVVGMSTPAAAQGGGAHAIEGVWSMSLTLRDCASGAALGPPFRTLLTFHSGGTLSETPGSTQFAPGQRSSGHGLWSHAGGNSYTARFLAMILFDTPPAPPAPGFQTGWLVVGSNFTMPDSTRLTITASAQFYDINRNVYRSACPTGTAERFQ
jgi:hypothetical protein